ncbi:15197_t:CDS:1 [Acaulospora morrowiae]|uniref:15197_t:CDS:1 n=1 Tax=Acaulospora morrowiae TaxID=94023 RepID=A0A9N9FU20_9GLOM|nr:15197_t:CDS:1 [Acaulospora morrowiae]
MKTTHLLLVIITTLLASAVNADLSQWQAVCVNKTLGQRVNCMDLPFNNPLGPTRFINYGTTCVLEIYDTDTNHLNRSCECGSKYSKKEMFRCSSFTSERGFSGPQQLDYLECNQTDALNIVAEIASNISCYLADGEYITTIGVHPVVYSRYCKCSFNGHEQEMLNQTAVSKISGYRYDPDWCFSTNTTTRETANSNGCCYGLVSVHEMKDVCKMLSSANKLSHAQVIRQLLIVVALASLLVF